MRIVLLVLTLCLGAILLYSCGSGGGGGTPATTTTTLAPTTMTTLTTTTTIIATTTTLAPGSTTTTTTIATTTTSPGSTTTTTTPASTSTTTTTTSSTTTTLAAPSGVSATQGNWSDKIVISWNPVSGATGYYVYRSTLTNEGFGFIGPSGASPCNDSAATPEAVFYYRVRAQKDGTPGAVSSYAGGVRSNGIVYVSQNNGNDSYHGVAADRAFATITAGTDLMKTGNNTTLKIAQGTYNEQLIINGTSYAGHREITAVLGGYSNDFTGRSTDRQSNVTTVQKLNVAASGVGNAYTARIDNSNTSLITLEGFVLKYSSSSSSIDTDICTLKLAYNSNVNVINNTIDCSLAVDKLGSGINITYNGVQGLIKDNIITATNTGGTAYGIRSTDASLFMDDIDIDSNKIDASSTGANRSVYTILNPGDNTVIKNNVLTCNNTAGSGTANPGYNVYISNNKDPIISNNTMIAKGRDDSNPGNKSYSVYLLGSSSQPTVVNNIFYPIHSTAGQRYGIYISSGTPTALNNNFFLNCRAYSSGDQTTEAEVNALGFAANNKVTDEAVADLIFTSKDDATPKNGIYSLKYNATSEAFVIDKGLNSNQSQYGSVDKDITGVSRGSPPEIGAYEF